MPPVARVVVPELPHHITQRGNNRQDVFFTDDDRWFCLETLETLREKGGKGGQFTYFLTALTRDRLA